MNPRVPPFTKKEVSVPEQDDELMRRFLVGDISPEERERVERRFIDDSAYFEALCALEDDMILAHLRQELPDPWRERFAASIGASAARGRRVQEVEHILRTLQTNHEPQPAPSRALPDSPGRRRAPWIGLLLAAASVAGILLAGWLVRRQNVLPPALVSEKPVRSSEAPAVATFVLIPGPSRSDAQRSNTFRLPAGGVHVRFQVVLDSAVAGPVHARLRPVGGDLLALPSETETRQTPEGLEVSWLVEAARLTPGDYLLALQVPTTSGTQETIASRFFSIVE